MTFQRTLSLLLTAVLLAATGTASATNGYFTHGTGTKNKSMAGAGLAGANDAISVANNPAAAVFATGKFDAGAAVFSPLRSYSSSTSMANGNGGAFTIGPNNIDSDRNYFVIPHVAKSWAFGSDAAFAVAFYGRGGMNSKWLGGTASFDPGIGMVVSPPGTFGAGKAGVDLSQAFLDLVYARKSGNFAWGAGLVVGIQAFEAYGVGSFAPFTQTFAQSGGTVLPENLSDNGHEFSVGVGAKIGFDTKLTDTIGFAAAYQSEIGMSELDEYSDLFAEGGGFDIPANAKIGITFKASPELSISVDAEHIWYNDVASVGNPISNIFGCPTVNPLSMDFSGCLGGSNGAGFGWDDMTVYKIGAEWNMNPDLILRAGYSHGSQPIASTEVLFNILAPAVIEDHIAFGFTRKRSETSQFSMSFMYAFNGEASGTNPFDPTQTLTIEMYQWEVEFSYSWSF